MSTPVRRGIYGRLAGDTTLTNLLAPAAPGYTQAIYHDDAPDGANFPYVSISKSSGTPTEAFGTPSAFENDVWQIKAVDRSPSADVAESIAARIKVLLNDAPLSISGTNLLYCRRQSDVEYPEVNQGILYRHSGSLYKLIMA